LLKSFFFFFFFLVQRWGSQRIVQVIREAVEA